MDNQTLLILGAAAFVNIILLYLVINIATKADKRAKYELAQVDLLAKIAKSSGVPESEINKTLELIQ